MSGGLDRDTLEGIYGTLYDLDHPDEKCSKREENLYEGGFKVGEELPVKKGGDWEKD